MISSFHSPQQCDIIISLRYEIITNAEMVVGCFMDFRIFLLDVSLKASIHNQVYLSAYLPLLASWVSILSDWNC